MKVANDKFILDACCGARHFWFNKNHPNTLYIDNRNLKKGHMAFRPQHQIVPDMVSDFREMPFEDNTFRLVVWDPPHIFWKNGIMAIRYGSLNAETWQHDLQRGFNECWRVLQEYGILILKWNDRQIKVGKILELLPVTPLFGHTTGKIGFTHWMCFMKIPKKIKKIIS